MRRSALFLLIASLALAGCMHTGISTGGIKNVKVNALQNGHPQDPVHGVETAFAIGALSGTGETTANGVGSTHLYADGTFAVAVQLNIAPVTATSFYEGWIEQADGSNPISLGHLTNAKGDERYAVVFQTNQNLRATHVKIVIRMRNSATPNTPGEVVATGLMKSRKR